MPHLATIDWDYRDRLKEADLGGGGTAYYTYDTGGERISKVVDNGSGLIKKTIYLGGYEVYREILSGTVDKERETVHFMDDQRRIVLVQTLTIDAGAPVGSPTDVIKYQLDNHLGSACLELDTSANIISYEEYHPFGTTSYRSGNSAAEVSLKKYKYVGKERDDETGLYYYGARYYAAWMCRFISVDPLKDQYPYYTPYQYAGNKPIVSIDIDGLESSTDIGQQNQEYTVKSGDYPEAIAQKFGISVWELAKMNQGAQEGGGHFSSTGNGNYKEYWGEGMGEKWSMKPGDVLNVTSGMQMANKNSISENTTESNYVASFAIKMFEFKLGLAVGMYEGGKETADFLISLGTTQGWKDLGQGLIDLGEFMNPNSPKGMIMKINLYFKTKAYVENIPEMTPFEMGKDMGYGIEKVAEAIITRKVMPIPKSSLGIRRVGLASKYTTYSSLDMKGSFGALSKRLPTPLSGFNIKTIDRGTFLNRNFVIPSGRVVGVSQFQYLQSDD